MRHVFRKMHTSRKMRDVEHVPQAIQLFMLYIFIDYVYITYHNVTYSNIYHMIVILRLLPFLKNL